MFAELLQSVQPVSRLDRMVDIFVAGAVPVILWMVDNRRRARKEALAEQEKTRIELEKKHKENTKRLDQQDDKLDEIINERKYIPAHFHRELAGPLSVEGIHFPKI